MPIADLSDPAAERGVTASVSAVGELFWLLPRLAGAKHAQEGSPIVGLREREPELSARIASFWDDSEGWLTELFPIAQRGGTLFDPELDRFLETFEDVTSRPLGPLGLESESPEEIALVERHLAALRDDPDLRRRFRELLADAWAVARPFWDGGGRAAVEASVASIPERIARAGSVLSALPEKHVGRRFGDMVRSAESAGEIVLIPTYLAGHGRYLIKLPGLLIIGVGMMERDRMAERRAEAEALVSRLKVLCDPTRVLILAHLASEELSVTDLVEELELAQPTISGHVRQLREAGLLDVRRDGGRTLYRTTPERVDGLLDATRSALRGICDA